MARGALGNESKTMGGLASRAYHTVLSPFVQRACAPLASRVCVGSANSSRVKRSGAGAPTFMYWPTTRGAPRFDFGAGHSALRGISKGRVRAQNP